MGCCAVGNPIKGFPDAAVKPHKHTLSINKNHQEGTFSFWGGSFFDAVLRERRHGGPWKTQSHIHPRGSWRRPDVYKRQEAFGAAVHSAAQRLIGSRKKRLALLQNIQDDVRVYENSHCLPKRSSRMASSSGCTGTTPTRASSATRLSVSYTHLDVYKRQEFASTKEVSE